MCKSGDIERQRGQWKGNAGPASPAVVCAQVLGLQHAWLGTRSSGLLGKQLTLFTDSGNKDILCPWRDRLVKVITFGLDCPQGHKPAWNCGPEALP